MSVRRERAARWLDALNQAVWRQFPAGARRRRALELNLMSDNGSPPTSVKFRRAAASLGIHQALRSDSNPKGNADTERLIRTIKEELVWLREWSSVEVLAQAAAAFVEECNEGYLHSA